MEQTCRIDAFGLLRSAEDDAAAAGRRVEAKARLRFAVAQALTQGRIGFYFQPVVRAADPRMPAFFEMLARMTTSDRQVLSAGAFLPAVEDCVLGRAVDRLALAHALKALARDPGLRLSVNISPRSMGDADWLAILAAAARGGSGVCGRLILEISEDAAVADCAQTIDFMNHVRATGCAFALDDFGAGATGFRHLRDFRFDLVKIDGTFVHGVHKARDSQVLIECLSAVARHFEMFTVAERVEDPADADWLRGMGIDCFQGYLYGRPAPSAELPPAEARHDHKAAG